MLGLAFLVVVLAAIGGIVFYKLGWKGATAALVALGTGLYAGGQQMWDALSAFFGSVL